MAEVETLGILEEIQSLISDKLQVVSYKWLSRNFLLSSNTAKKLLQDFVEKNEDGFEAVYALSGLLKKNTSEYHVKLVPGHKLSEAKHEFENCSVQVYSVQACLPKDAASLWNNEFIQAEELYRQPPDIDNCLRDNRFCAISNPFVKRIFKGDSSTISPQSQKSGLPGLPLNGLAKKTSIPPESSLQKSHQSIPLDNVKAIKTETNAKDGVHEQAGKPPSDKVKAAPVHHEKPKDKSNKTTSGNGTSLANMWGRASAKTKSSSIMEETKTSVTNLSESDAHAHETSESKSDEDDCDVNFRRTSKGDSRRKRRVVCDFSDDENDNNEDAISLASPDPPRGKSLQDVVPDTKTSIPDKSSLNLHKQKMEGSTIKKEETVGDIKSIKPSVAKRNKELENASSDKMQGHIPEISSKTNNKGTDAASTSSPKRRKVLKTRIDERGREVTEVVWEGEDGGKKDDDKGSSKNAEDSKTVSTTTSERPPAAAAAVTKKSPAVKPNATSSKAGLKKGGNAKDPKQGNIMSFFKKA
ncbi:DNA polymerase delta subunit 3 [Impatiens glandulifera]|uniref:DNA polymerase delta subunit 3 n=1 Tax=Impatiens glandulifera TaxID=253017 RepID=UPI001FB097EA|nr:DNA polymerase delta subunit 3 [Impatiens glandulifera]